MKTWHIHIEGQVQGVGFRPFIYRLAVQENIFGWVSNTIDGVHIELNGDERKANHFLSKIINQKPALAQVTASSLYAAEEQSFEHFTIIESKKEGVPNLLLSPDFGMCVDCQKELRDTGNRRVVYPFNTCTNCGPRYSIIEELPYDRETTTMQLFTMCASCSDEYHNPLNRRYFSQTNSCPDCAIELSFFDHNLNLRSLNVRNIIEQICQLWTDGKIIAIKGIGGYLLTCDAHNEQAIIRLRRLKHRPTKPFALIFPDISSLEKVVDISDIESIALQSVVAPIVLLDIKETVDAQLPFESIAPNLHQIGVMLPYTPLLDLLMKKYTKPIIATSGNISNSPIVYQDEKAKKELSLISDFVLTNNRKILVPQDDGLVRYSYFKKQKIIMRRARGLAPSYINPDLNLSTKTILATGAMLKSSFTFLHQGNVFISQYLGDLAHFDTEESYRQTIQHFFNIFKSQPEIILCDAHPEYPSTIFAQELATNSNLPVQKVQHHLAHFSAILGEHNLMQTPEPILGVIWDGTGLGDDRNIWGGEFFVYKNYEFERCGHLSYFDFILGDKMPKEPRISALVIGKQNPDALEFLRDKFTEEEWKVYHKILLKDSPLKCSSMGRLFDAVASLLNLCDLQSFEGEAAMRLETIALEYCQRNGLDFKSSYVSKTTSNQMISVDEIVTGILQDIRNNIAVDFIAAKFHYSLVQAIDMCAHQLRIEKIAFSGGVFQNGLLIDLLQHHLSAKYSLYFHQSLSPNDENISFGQLIYHQIRQELRNK